MKKIKFYVYFAFLIAAIIGIMLVINYSKTTPPEIILIEPENGSFLKTRNVTLSWKVSYEKEINFIKSLYFGSATPTEIVYEGLDNSYTINDLKPGTYYWKVALKYGKREIESPIYSFTVVNVPPQIPILQSPKNEVKITEMPIEFTWVANDPDNDELRYDFYLGKYSVPEKFAEEISENRIIINDLIPGRYYWKVVAKDSFGGKSESEIYSFEYLGEEINIPILNLEKHDNYVKVFWEKSEDLKYTLELYEDGNIKTIPVEESFYNINIIPGVKYKVRLKVEDEYGRTAYSEFKEFSKENTPPKFTILFPPDNLKGATDKIVFRWEVIDPDDDAFVNFYFGETPNELKLKVSNYKGKIFEVRNLQPNTDYYWKIIIYDSFTKLESPIYKFSTGPLVKIKNIYGTAADDIVNDLIKYENSYVILGTRNNIEPFLLKIKDFNDEDVFELNLNEKGQGVKVLEHNESLYILGNSEKNNGDLFLASVNNWKVEWIKNYGGFFKDIASDMLIEDDGLLILGYSWSDDFIGKLYGWCDVFLMKVDFQGNIKWIKKFGGEQYDEGLRIQKLNDGYVIAANTTSLKFDVPKNYGSKDMWIFSIDKQGKFKWLRVFGTKDSDEVSNMKVIDGKIYVIGKTYKEKDNEIDENSNIWIIVLDEKGNKIQEYLLSGNGNDVANDILKIGKDEFLLLGYTNSTSGDFYTNYYSKKGYYDFFISKIFKGDLEWSRVSGGYGYDMIKKALIDGDDIIFVGNSSSSNGEFDFNNGGFDIFIGNMKIER
ncbi:MAG: hypothetical protein PWP02_3 [Thermosipho sp. (in: thermotogales)]|nr:hypothetical protein [Thermosipho sp. (in: thermotogales)]